jgi:hypothetical protein
MWASNHRKEQTRYLRTASCYWGYEDIHINTNRYQHAFAVKPLYQYLVRNCDGRFQLGSAHNRLIYYGANAQKYRAFQRFIEYQKQHADCNFTHSFNFVL